MTTKQLHDVLHDIASDVPQVDLVAGVASRTAQIRWLRRAAVGGTALGVAAVVGLVTIGLPAWQQATRPDRELPATQPVAPPLASVIDLDAASPGVLDAANGLVVVADPDGTVHTIALDVEDGRAAVLDTAVPDDITEAHLSSDGSRALLAGATSVVVIDMRTGRLLYETTRPKHVPLTLSWDGARLISFRVDPEAVVGDLPVWQLASTDLATGEVTGIGPSIGRSSVAGQMWAGPDNATVFVRYDGSAQDNRTYRIALATGQVIHTEPYSALKISSMHWPADGSVQLAETTSSVRIMTPSPKIGDLINSMRKLGHPLGFAGPDHLVWWRPGTGEPVLVLSDLVGNELPDTTTISSSGSVLAIATALG